VKVLLVEDCADIQRVLARLLRRQYGDVDVWVSDNADLAIEYLKESVLEREFDLIICDWNLIGPRTGGDVLEWVETHVSHLVKRFLFLTSDESAQDRGVPCVAKGSDVPVLRSTIQNVLTNNHPDG